jgi:hypothetical protein
MTESPEPSPLASQPTVNPYAPPEASLSPPPVAGVVLAEAEAIRRAHLNHESNVRSIGALHLLGAVLAGIGLAASVASFEGSMGRASRVGAFLTMNVAFLALNAALGIGLIRLQPWARWLEAAVVGVYLFVQATTTLYLTVAVGRTATQLLFVSGLMWLIPALVLYLMLAPKAAMVFSPEYREVIARTPHIRHRTSCVMWLLLIVVLFFGFAGLVAVLFTR